MYLMALNEYECDLCGFHESWGAYDDRLRYIWECERCGTHFCTSCFAKAIDYASFRKMLTEHGQIHCPNCWRKCEKE